MFPRSIFLSGSTILSLALVAAMPGAARAEVSPGDMNCDGVRNSLDIAPFVQALIAPSAYLAAYPNCTPGNVDFDCDWAAGTGDISGFVECLLTGNCPPCVPPGMALVPAGQSWMGDVWYEGAAEERPPHTVSLSPFCIDKLEVTCQQYVQGLNWALAQGGLISVVNTNVFQAGSGTSYPYCDTSAAGGIHWNGATFNAVTGWESRPMVMVSWYGAVAYCNWRSTQAGREPCFDLSTWACDFTKNGYRLATEAEWEKAAGWDPVQQRTFRFGEHTDGCGYNCLDGHRANYGQSGDPYEVGNIPYSTPVGYYDGSNHGGYQTQDAKCYYGCRDMSGNVWEWCYDRYSATYYSISPTTDPTGPTTGAERVQRGGSWFTALPSSDRVALRNRHAPIDRNPNDGFRCVVGRP